MIRWALVSLAVVLAIVNSGCAGVVADSEKSPTPEAPAITAQPASQTIVAGKSATFSVAATGTAPLAYQWKKNNVAISGATSSSYATPAATSSDNGAQYNVTVTNAAGSATSVSAKLTVNAAAVAPSVTTQPASQSVTVGQSASFSVAATGTAPLSYQWMKNGVAISGATASSYTTPATTTADSGSQFSVTISNSAGSATSSIATLTVSAAAVAPSITTQPASQTVTAGQSASFSVAATGTAPLSYQWKKNSVAISGATASSYTTPATTTADSGALFTVVVSNASGSVTSAAATLTVKTGAVAPSITSQPASQTVTAGQSASFSVAATGTAPLSYQWKKNNVAISGATASSYTTPATTTANSGSQFSVTISNAAGGATSGSATLTVNAATPTLQITTSNLAGGTVAVAYTSTLAASGGKAPYTWSLSNGTLPTGLTLSSAGAISGTPTVAGSFSFTVAVKDSTSASASANLSINVVTAAPPSVSISSPSNGATVSGSISVSGSASDGLTISSVQVSVDGGSFSSASGTSSWTFPLNTNSLSNGAHTLAAKVSDSGGNSATSSLVDITVNNASTSTNCTIYASPSGGGNGTSSSSPLTFSAAASATQPGSVVCLLGGTYNLSSTFVPPNSGSPASWITYKNYDTTPVNFVWTGAADAEPMFKVGNGSFPSGPAYIQFQGLNLNGNGTAADGFFCRGGHHARFIGNSITNTGGSGIGSINCDYLTADHNLISHNGYIPSNATNPSWYSWTSAISYNTHMWYDNYTGIHSVISNNIITGEVDQSPNHTDGNGIILDLGGNTPPALIINNVVYGNGGRCIEPNQVQNFYVINNTCYKNALDPNEPNFPEFGVNGSSNGYMVNNIGFAVSSGNPGYAQYNTVSNVAYSESMYDVGAPNFSASGLVNANPLFLAPPSLAMGGFVSSLLPSLLGTDLTLTPLLSPALGKGIDPSAISGLSASIVSDLKTYIYTDINGKARPQGSGSDLGAYQH